MNQEYTVEINIPPHKRGDRWPGIAAIGPILINGVQPTNALTRVRMHFKNAAGTTYRLDTDSNTTPDAPINIDNATTWTASIPEVEDFISANGKWSWDMEFYEAGKTKPLTLYKGTLTVANDTTR